jgi:hypothetical protein
MIGERRQGVSAGLQHVVVYVQRVRIGRSSCITHQISSAKLGLNRGTLAAGLLFITHNGKTQLT